MTAILIDSPGEPNEVLSCGDTQSLELSAGSVRVEMLAAPINPSDLSFIRDTYGLKPDCPQSPGFEGVGVVVEANAGLFGKLLKGRRVVVLHPHGGTWADTVVVPAKRVVPVGDSITVEQAATFFVNPATAWVLCREVLDIPRREVLLQTAAASNLGRMIVRLAKQEGIRTVSIVRREEQREELAALGGDHVVVFDTAKETAEDLAAKIKSLNLGTPIRHAIDPIGGAVVPAILGVLAKQGRLVLYGSLSGEDSSVSSRHMLTTGQSIEGFWLTNWMEQRSLWQKMSLIRKLKGLIADGVTTTQAFSNYRPEQIQEAVSAAENASSGEKVLLRFDGAV